MRFDFTIVQEWGWYIVQGVGVILQLSLFAAILGIIIGTICAFLKKKKVIGWFVSFYIDIFRGTPVFFQLYFARYGIPALLGIPAMKDIMLLGIIVFGLNSGAYLAEIMRAGIEGIDKGQVEAAKALGVSQKDIMKDIVIPQAIRAVLPALMNEFITLTKETSVASAIGIMDMMKRYTIVVAKTYSAIEPLVIIGISYYALNKILSYLGKILERKLQYD